MKELTEAEILAGVVTVTTTAGPVSLKIIPLRSQRELSKVWTDEPALLKLVGGFTDAQLDKLNDSDWELLVKEAQRINFLRFQAWSARMAEAVKAYDVPGAATLAEQVVAKMQEQSASAA